MRCTTCGVETSNICRLCDPCISARVDRERTEQGLPLEPSDETMERVARMLRPAAASRGAA